MPPSVAPTAIPATAPFERPSSPESLAVDDDEEDDDVEEASVGEATASGEVVVPWDSAVVFDATDDFEDEELFGWAARVTLK